MTYDSIYQKYKNKLDRISKNSISTTEEEFLKMMCFYKTIQEEEKKAMKLKDKQ